MELDLIEEVQEIKIDTQFRDLLPPLSEEEYAALEASILKEGCRESLITWNGYLIDGFHRRTICLTHGIEFGTREMEFNDREEAIQWMISNQDSRRNMSPYDRIKLALLYEPAIAEKAKANQRLRAEGSSTSDGPYESIDTREEVAKIAHASTGNITKVKEIDASASDEVKKAVSSGAISINEAYNITKKQKNAVKKDAESPSATEPAAQYGVVILDHPGLTDDTADKAIPIQSIPCSPNAYVWILSSNDYLPKAMQTLRRFGLAYISTAIMIEGDIDQENLECKFIVFARNGNVVPTQFPAYFIGDAKENFYEFIRNSTKGKKVNVTNGAGVEGFEHLSI